MPSIQLNKQRWKQVLLIAAAVIAGATLWFTNDITKQVKKQERAKVVAWHKEVVARSEVVANYTEQLFKELQEDERQKADRLADAYRIIDNPPPGMDLTFPGKIIKDNNTVPVP